MAHLLERTGASGAQVTAWSEVERALDALMHPPGPWVCLSDEWGNLLRAEGAANRICLQARSVGPEGVTWWGIGQDTPPGTQVPVHLAGRIVKVAPTEVLELEFVKQTFKTFLEEGQLGSDVHRRPLDGNHGRMYMMVLGGNEPRPALGWIDIARQVSALPEDGEIAGALSEPGRILIGVFGAQDKLTITVREYRGGQSWEHRVATREGGRQLVDAPLPNGSTRLPAAQVLTRADAQIVLESLYRFDTPPPGYAWDETV